MQKFVIAASALALLATPALAATTKYHHKTHGRVAQGPAGLNFNSTGPNSYPWSGPANGRDNPISGSPQDPGMRGPLAPPTPGR